LHFRYYNFARLDMSLATPYPRTPAMAPRVSDHVWKIEETYALIDLDRREGIGPCSEKLAMLGPAHPTNAERL
jgi:hypothetical protein